MFKSMMLAAVATTTVLFAGAAGAADLRVSNPAIHISVAGKTTVQVRSEIKAAANVVCGQADAECIQVAVNDANAQFAALTRSSGKANVDVARADPLTVHVSLAGKTRSQIGAEIQEAAQTVCKTVEGFERAACVSSAVEDANAQLRTFAQAERPRKLASN